jgi:hypothetical protein
MCEPTFMILGGYVMVPEPASTAYFTKPSHQSVPVCASLVVARQRLGKKSTAVTNIRARS